MGIRTISRQEHEQVVKFFEGPCYECYCRANKGRVKERAKELVDGTNFSIDQLLYLWEMLRYDRERVVQVYVLKRVVEMASTVEDWIKIADSAPATGELRRRAYEEVCRFEPDGKVIKLLQRSGSVVLRNVGWYLAQRKAFVEQDKEN